MSGFVVQGPKSDDRDSSGSKNRLFPTFFRECGGGASCPTFSLIEETWHRAKAEVYRGEHMFVQTGQAAPKKKKNGNAIRALKT